MKLLGVVLSALVLGACVQSGERAPAGPVVTGADGGACDDRDLDGYGEGCAKGGDCNDLDPKVHVGCVQCNSPQQGCACDIGSKPVSCYLTPTNDDGVVMCREGTRYCRGGSWSGCESVTTYPKPEQTNPEALVTPGAPVEHCNDCSVNCYVVRDNLNPVDAGLDATSSNVSAPDGGGLTLTFSVPDAGAAMDSGTKFDPSKCVLGTAPDHDCDGIPDDYDPYPDQKPFATANPTLFLDLAAGETGTGVINLQFYLNSADIYFLIDQTGSMDQERDQLKADLTTGDVLMDPSYDCADYDFDFKPNNELKTQGLIGAVRCIIRDANFGMGYFREIPLHYGDSDSVTYRNVQDITSSIPSITAAINTLTTVGNADWPEASMLALNSVVTGNGYYFGPSQAAVATRSGCPANTWGYPCFRNSAIPIVLMFTDAEFHNGPSNNDYAYNSSYLGYTKGSSTTTTNVNNTNETYATAYDLGDLTNATYTYVGNTTGMNADEGANAITCGSSDASSPDAMFKFTLSSTKTLKATTIGSDFDTTLTILKGQPTGVTPLPSYPNTNDTVGTAYDFGAATGKAVSARGDSSALVSDYSANDVGCGAAAGAKDATFTFSLPSSTKVSLDTSGSSYGTTLALFNGTPPSNLTYTAIPNTNDAFASAYSVGSLNGMNVGFRGDTSAAGITADYSASQLSCSSAPADTAPDAVYTFSLSSATKVRISTEDSPTKTVVALTDNGANYTTSGTSNNLNEAQASALDLGVLDGTGAAYSGSTSSMTANYTNAVVGCNSTDSSRDAVYKFNLNSSRTLSFDTIGSSIDTVLGLFRSNIGASGTTSSTLALSGNAFETGATAQDLGTLNNVSVQTTGGTTSGMLSDYTGAQIGCSSSDSSPDAVFKFHLASPTSVRVETTGSSFDTVASLHSSLPDQTVTAIANTNDTVANARAVAPSSSNPYQSFDGNTGGLAANVPVSSGSCSADSSAKDAVFAINVPVTGNYEINTIGSSFDTILGLYPSTVYNPTAPTPVSEGVSGETSSSPVAIGALDGQWLSFTGNTSTMSKNTSFSSCSADTNSKDAFYSFSLSSSKTVVIDTSGSSYDTVIAIYKSNNTYIDCNNDGSGLGTASQLTEALTAGSYYVMIKGRGTTSSGAYKITFRDSAVSTTTNLLYCDDDSGNGTAKTSKISASLSAGTYYAVVKGKAAANSGSYRLTVKALDSISGANRLYCDNDTGSGSTSSFDTGTLAAGDYFIVVKGTSSSAKGSFTLRVSDLTTPPGFVACNDDPYFWVSYSSIQQTLPAGTYYVVVKGRSSTGGSYKLNIRDNAAMPASTLACDYNSGGGGTSLIETNLNAGTYRVIVKGKAATDKGPYNLILRDLNAVPTQRLYCDHTSASDGKSKIEQTLSAGTYTVVLKGDTSAGAGAYRLNLVDGTNLQSSEITSACNNDVSWSNETSSISQSLGAGTYYAVVKGYSGSDRGYYQLNIGAGGTSSATFSPPTWSQTLQATNAKSVRVMPILSCHDDPQYGDTYRGFTGDCTYTRQQATVLANSTGAVGKNLAPLVFDIDSDGKGLSTSVVNGIAALANYLEMNVSLRIAFDPDANPGFDVVVKAVDAPGDGCSGLVNNEHQHCVPGASPRFEVQFTNPKDSPVPLNPKDANGGYNFRAELIGDQQFVVDKVPIYIVPRDVDHSSMPVAQVAPSGTYWQDIASPGCTGNLAPDWHDLNWTVDTPNGTSVSFAVCAANEADALGTCDPKTLATITGGGACTADADCTNGYCGTAGNCQTITGGSSCTLDTDCTTGSTCKSGKCYFSRQPVYIGGLLGTTNYDTALRMRINLTGNTTDNTSPTVHDWNLTYVCNSVL
jgi:hypothetical protein